MDSDFGASCRLTHLTDSFLIERDRVDSARTKDETRSQKRRKEGRHPEMCSSAPLPPSFLLRLARLSRLPSLAGLPGLSSLLPSFPLELFAVLISGSFPERVSAPTDPLFCGLLCVFVWWRLPFCDSVTFFLFVSRLPIPSLPFRSLALEIMVRRKA